MTSAKTLCSFLSKAWWLAGLPRALPAALLLLLAACADAPAEPPLADEASWGEVTASAQGQTVYWYAWGGDPRINAYIDWAAGEIDARYGVELRHVKVQDTAEAVSRLVAEDAAGRAQGGSIDLLWINGENFAALKSAGLLYGPFLERLPSAAALDLAGDPGLTTDFAIDTEGYEAPWGRSYLTFAIDTRTGGQRPESVAALARWARAQSGLFPYPSPPDFAGTTFLKQVMLTLAPATIDFAQPPDDAAFEQATGPLFAYLDALHPFLWRNGRAFPASAPAQRQLLADGEIALTMAFNPTDAISAISRGQLSPTVEAFTLESGTIANSHFLAIPKNASARAGALVVIDFLLSAEAQRRKADPKIWGDGPVLAFAGEAAMPSDIPLPNPAFEEPHPAWTERLETAWMARYGE